MASGEGTESPEIVAAAGPIVTEDPAPIASDIDAGVPPERVIEDLGAQVLEAPPLIGFMRLEQGAFSAEATFDQGDDLHDLALRLHDKIVAQRNGEAPVEMPDPNLLHKARATAIGHDIDPELKQCRRCGQAEWACLESAEPCVPRAFDGEAA